MNKLNEIALRRLSCLVVNHGDGTPASKAELATFMKNIEAYGFTVSKSLYDVLKTFSLKSLEKLGNELNHELKAMVGAHKRYRPMYPNFPSQVMDADMAELYTNAMLHYFGDFIGVRIMPAYDADLRNPLPRSEMKIRVIGLTDEARVRQMFKGLMSSKTSISATDMSDLGWYINDYKGPVELPDEIPHKEILSFVSANMLKHGRLSWTPYVKTATDVLRIAVAMSDGDVSLATPTEFNNISRSNRKILLSVLENCNGKQEDMLRHKGYWIRLGEKLHAGDYIKRFPTSVKALNALQTNKHIDTFSSKIEKSVFLNDLNESLSLLEKRPGEFARRLDKLARDNKSDSRIISAFKGVANQVSIPVLLQVKNHFENRDDELKVIFPKGSVSKVCVIDNNTPAIDDKFCSQIVKICSDAIMSNFASRSALGKVYVDPEYKNYTVPFSLRSASKSLKTISRGSRLSMGDNGTIRFFLWWKQPSDQRVDVDLSAIGYDENFKSVKSISYYNLRTEKMGCHSGDITSAPNGACEFIDIDIKKALASGLRYIGMNVFSFTKQFYCDMPECFAGWMMRNKVDSGEIFDARTVENKFDLSVKATAAMPAVFDLKKREVIWLDLSMKSERISNHADNKFAMDRIVKGMVESKKANMYDLFMLHAKARGTVVSTSEDADVVFSPKKGEVLAHEFDKIIGSYL